MDKNKPADITDPKKIPQNKTLEVPDLRSSRPTAQISQKTARKWSRTRFVMYILSFLFTLHYALPAYINSSFLEQFTSSGIVSLLYSIAALFTIVVFAFMPRILNRFGNYRVMVTFLLIELASLVGLASSSSLLRALPFFILSFMVVSLINFNMDVFLENVSVERVMGEVRGFFLTSANSSWIVASVLMSFILTGNEYWKIYVAAAVLIVPVLLLLNANLKDFKNPVYVQLPIIKTVREIVQNKNIRAIFIVGFILQFFYAWMTIYTPIYLHAELAFSWQQIGIMFSIMLLPFVLTEIPLGELADGRSREKKIMTVGLLIAAFSTGIMAFITGNNIFLWTAMLFISRIGASMIEIMTETYFFKKIDGASANLIGFYRTMRPFSYLISPIVATALFAIPYFNFKYIFAALGLLLLFGLRYSLTLEDIA